MDAEGAAAQAEAEWDEWQEGDEWQEDATQSLFGPEKLPSAEAAMQHDATQHGFDLKAYAAQVSPMALPFTDIDGTSCQGSSCIA